MLGTCHKNTGVILTDLLLASLSIRISDDSTHWLSAFWYEETNYQGERERESSHFQNTHQEMSKGHDSCPFSGCWNQQVKLCWVFKIVKAENRFYFTTTRSGERAEVHSNLQQGGILKREWGYMEGTRQGVRWKVSLSIFSAASLIAGKIFGFR